MKNQNKNEEVDKMISVSLHWAVFRILSKF